MNGEMLSMLSRVHSDWPTFSPILIKFTSFCTQTVYTTHCAYCTYSNKPNRKDQHLSIRERTILNIHRVGCLDAQIASRSLSNVRVPACSTANHSKHWDAYIACPHEILCQASILKDRPMSKIWHQPQQVRVAKFIPTQQQSD